MASRPIEETVTAPKRKLPRRKGSPRLVVIHGGRELANEEGQALLRQIGDRMNDRQRPRRLNRIEGYAPERRSVERAMLAVEDRLVRALWVLARLPNDRGIGFAARNGIDYTPDREDRFAAAVAAGGKWDQPLPKPPVPSGRDIDAMYEPLDWLRFLDRDQARLLTVAAQSKRGDVSNNIRWSRVRKQLPSTCGLTLLTLHRRYRGALRDIVTELTIAKAAAMK